MLGLGSFAAPGTAACRAARLISGNAGRSSLLIKRTRHTSGVMAVLDKFCCPRGPGIPRGTEKQGQANQREKHHNSIKGQRNTAASSRGRAQRLVCGKFNIAGPEGCSRCTQETEGLSDLRPCVSAVGCCCSSRSIVTDVQRAHRPRRNWHFCFHSLQVPVRRARKSLETFNLIDQVDHGPRELESDGRPLTPSHG